MKQEYLIYAEQLSRIGDEIQRAANVFGMINVIASSKTKEDLQTEYTAYQNALEGYRESKRSFLNISPPKILKHEHIELADAIGSLVNSVETMLSAIDIENAHINEKLLQKGFTMQRESVKSAESVVDRMVDIMRRT